MKPERLQALTDGVFAIAMTLLAFQIKVPAMAHDLSSGQFWSGLQQVRGRAIIYAISFIVLGAFWVAQYFQYVLVKRVNLRFMWLTMLFLLLIGFIPFSAELIGTYPDQRIAILIYGTNLWLCSAVLYSQLEYSINSRQLTDRSEVSPELRRRIHQRVVGSPAFYVLGILASFINTHISLVLFAIPPIFSILPSRARDRARQIGGSAPAPDAK